MADKNTGRTPHLDYPEATKPAEQPKTTPTSQAKPTPVAPTKPAQAVPTKPAVVVKPQPVIDNTPLDRKPKLDRNGGLADTVQSNEDAEGEEEVPMLNGLPNYTYDYVSGHIDYKGGRLHDISTRLAKYMQCVVHESDLTKIHYSAHFMIEILYILNRLHINEFEPTVQSMMDFFQFDLETHGKDSAIFDFHCHRPFLGTRPHASIFLEMMRQAASPRTRQHMAGVYANSRELHAIFPNRFAGLFIGAMQS